MYTFICVHIWTSLYKYTYLHKYIYTYLYIRIYMLMYINVYIYVYININMYIHTDVYILERCQWGTRWAHGCGAQGTQVWVIDTRRGGGTLGWSLIKVYLTELNIRYARVRASDLLPQLVRTLPVQLTLIKPTTNGYIFSYRTHTFSHPPVLFIEWRTTHHLHALKVAESSEAQKHITEHYKGGLWKGLSSDVCDFKPRANGTQLNHLVWATLA